MITTFSVLLTDVCRSFLEVVLLRDQTVPPEHRAERPQHNSQVQDERQTVDVLQITPNSLVPGNRVPAVDLSPTRQPGPNRQPAPLLGCVLFGLILESGTRADQTHLAGEDVEKLRQLVDAET